MATPLRRNYPNLSVSLPPRLVAALDKTRPANESRSGQIARLIMEAMDVPADVQLSMLRLEPEQSEFERQL